MTTAEPLPTVLAFPSLPEKIEKALVDGDLKGLSAEERVEFYNATCRSLGLNPLTKPFGYITLNSKLTLYALRTCTDQLRQIHGVTIGQLRHEQEGDLYSVYAPATDKNGRRDEDMGAVSIKGLTGDALANAKMKCVTKAKRRVTLSICGLGMLDETEVETIPSARREFTPLEPPGVPARKDIVVVPGRTSGSPADSESVNAGSNPAPATAHGPFISDEQVADLDSLMREIGATEQAVMKWLALQTGKGQGAKLESIRKEHYELVKGELEKRRVDHGA